MLLRDLSEIPEFGPREMLYSWFAGLDPAFNAIEKHLQDGPLEFGRFFGPRYMWCRTSKLHHSILLCFNFSEPAMFEIEPLNTSKPFFNIIESLRRFRQFHYISIFNDGVYIASADDLMRSGKGIYSLNKEAFEKIFSHNYSTMCHITNAMKEHWTPGFSFDEDTKLIVIDNDESDDELTEGRRFRRPWR
jgi:hypothetical protein